MQDRQISTTTAAAWALWAVAILATAAGLVWPNKGIGNIGVVCGIAAGTLHVRGMFCEHGQFLREAFELGRDAGRLETVPEQRGPRAMR